MIKSYEELRREYLRSSFGEDDAGADPLVQFRLWLESAIEESIPLANACALATATRGGRPSNRMVLLKSYDERGFDFATGYSSRKGQDLEENPHGCLLFWWTALERQIRIEGEVVRVAAEESDEYFASRPRASNLSALASRQSAVVASREKLESERSEVTAKFKDRELMRPSDWGGYRLVARYYEFWQGRADRLHDRLCYRQQGDSWVRERLYP